MFSVSKPRPMVNLPVQSITAGEGLFAFLALSAFVVILQSAAGAYASGFGGYPDEPAHLVTALMMRDFILGLDFHHPLQFAQQYYYHYPKVAIGHWPPLFYVVLSVWFLIVGASRVTALLFIALLAAATAGIIYMTGRRLMGRWAGLLASVLFVISPVVQESSARLMTEDFSALLMLTSALCFARFARTGRIRDGLAFGITAALAILAHPNAWALGLIPPLAIALTSRWWLLRRWGLWLSALPVLLLAVPWYVFTLKLLEDGVGAGSPFWIQAWGFAWSLYGTLGIVAVVFIAIGFWATIVRVSPRSEVAPEWAALIALAIATFALHSIIPTGVENRFTVPIVAALVLFAPAGIDAVVQRLRYPGANGVARIAGSLALIALFAVQRFSLPLDLRNGGYDALVHDVTAQIGNGPQDWLISSGATGEGCLVAAIDLQEGQAKNQAKSYVLRAKTILAGGDWAWNNTEDRFDTPEKLAKLLDEMPVTVVVIDNNIPPVDERPYQARLKDLLARDTDKWERIGTYSQIQDGVEIPNSLIVYARRPISALQIAAPPVRLDRLKALMVRNELR